MASEPTAAAAAAAAPPGHIATMLTVLRQWESQFEAQHGRKPDLLDIRKAPAMAGQYQQVALWKASIASHKRATDARDHNDEEDEQRSFRGAQTAGKKPRVGPVSMPFRPTIGAQGGIGVAGIGAGIKAGGASDASVRNDGSLQAEILAARNNSMKTTLAAPVKPRSFAGAQGFAQQQGKMSADAVGASYRPAPLPVLPPQLLPATPPLQVLPPPQSQVPPTPVLAEAASPAPILSHLDVIAAADAKAKAAAAASKSTHAAENFVRLNLRHKRWKGKKRPQVVAARKRPPVDFSADSFETTRKAPAMPLSDALDQCLELMDPASNKRKPQKSGVPFCQGHHMPCVLRTVRKANANQGRKFYACGAPRSESCGHFEWQDSSNAAVEQALKTVSSVEGKRMKELEAQFTKLTVAELRAKIKSARLSPPLWATVTAQFMTTTERTPSLSTLKKPQLVAALVCLCVQAESDARAALLSPQEKPSALKDTPPLVEDNTKVAGEVKEDSDSGSEPSDVDSGDSSDSESESTDEDPPHEDDNVFTFNEDDLITDLADLIVTPFASTADVAAQTDDQLFQKTQRCVQTLFGFSGCRAEQWWAIHRVLRGMHTLLVAPTGAGKSLCYIVPAALLPGLVIVVSPLLSLMADQLSKLPLSIRGACLSSTQTPVETAAVIKALEQRLIRVLYVSPERLFSASFRRLARTNVLGPISLVCVDEAHCVSMWSHNFRPSYLRLHSVIAEYLGACTTLSLTATATAETVTGIAKTLRIPQDGIRLGSWLRDQDNLALSVSCDKDKSVALVQLLSSQAFRKFKSAIVYVNQQREAEATADMLAAKFIKAAAYHGGMESKKRERVQAQFMRGTIHVLVATVAFGMGIDKPDIRAVIHAGLPQSIEDYVQQVGRAGRDGKPCFAHCFVDDAEFFKLHSRAHSDGVEQWQIMAFVNRLLKLAVPQYPQEVGISTTCLADELDLRPEVAETMLTWLENQGLVDMSPAGHLFCAVHVASIQPMKTIAQSPVLSKAKRMATDMDDLLVDLMTTANELHWTIRDVQRHLFELVDTKAIRVQWQEWGFRVTVPIEVEDTTPISDALFDHMRNLEACRILKTEVAYCMLHRCATPTWAMWHATQPPAEGASDDESDAGSDVAAVQAETRELHSQLKKFVSDYFADADHAGAHVIGDSTLPFSSISDANRAAVLSSIRSVMSQILSTRQDASAYRTCTGRAVARILHGIHSPAFPTATWRNTGSWGSLVHYKFEELHALANQQLSGTRLP